MKNFYRFLGVALVGSLLAGSIAFSHKIAAAAPQKLSAPLDVVQSFQANFQNPNTPSLHFDPSTSGGEMWWIAPDGKNIWITQAPKTDGSITPRSLTFDPNGGRIFSPELKNFINNVDSFMQDTGFTFDTKNSSTDYQDARFEDFVHGYTNGDTVCTLTVNTDAYSDPSKPNGETQIYFACSDQWQKYYKEQAPFLYALQSIGNDFVAVEEARSGNFVKVGAHERRGGFYAILEAVNGQNGQYNLIFSGQDVPPCALMYQHNVPKDLYGQCFNGTTVE